jgi:hypothetical protein
MPERAPPSIAEDTRISRGTSVLTALVNDEMVMMDVPRGHYYGLDRIGADIWSRLETPVSFAALVDGLAADYAAERAEIAGDVRRLLAAMLRHQVVRLD